MVARTVTKLLNDIFQTVTVSSGTTVSPSYTINSPTTSASSITWTGAGANGWTTNNNWSAVGMPAAGLNQGGKLQLIGENADIEINGESLVSMLKRIEQRINLLTVNTELEAEWDELRELGEQYRELEQRIKNKIKTWEKLKAQDQDNR